MKYLTNFLSWRIPVIACIVLIASVHLSGCLGDGTTKPKTPDAPTLPDLDPPITAVRAASESAGNIGKNVDASATKIDTHAKDIETNTPDSAKPKVQPSLDGIRTETKNLKDSSTELKVLSERLKDTEDKLGKEQSNVKKWIDYAGNADKEITSLQKKVAELEDENNALLKKQLTYLIVLCVMGLGVCGVLIFWTQSKIAIMVACGFGATMAIALAVTYFMKTIAIVAICVLGVAFLGVLGYIAWTYFANRKVQEELVHTNELAKQHLTPEAREKLYGYGAEPGKIDQIQSNVTKARVKAIRSYSAIKGRVKLAPRIPEFFRPADGHADIDPYSETTRK